MGSPALAARSVPPADGTGRVEAGETASGKIAPGMRAERGFSGFVAR
jgi:hypothetical protein